MFLISQKPAVEPIKVDSAVKEEYEKGEIDWTNGYIRAKGYGFVDPEKPKGKAKLLAERSAVVDARRNLSDSRSKGSGYSQKCENNRKA
jgi:hypothetical protein